METEPAGGENATGFKFHKSENDPKFWALETGAEIEGRKFQFILEPGALEYLSGNPDLVRDLEHDLSLILPDFYHHIIPGHKEDPLRVTLFRGQDGGMLFRLDLDNKPPRENTK